jgi:hypothetical protein
MKDLGRAMMDYGKRLAPAGNLWLPGAGAAAGAAMDAAGRALGGGTLSELRDRISRRMEETNTSP